MDRVIIMAGGKGTRLKSDVPKALYSIRGIPLIRRLVDTVAPVFGKPTVIVGYRADEVIETLGDSCSFVRQEEQLGTGHALMCAKRALTDREDGNIVVVPADSPLISAETLRELVALHEREGARLTLVVATVPDFEGDFDGFMNCGRIVRDENGAIGGIVEYKDATGQERALRELNVSYYCFDAEWLWNHVDTLGNENASGEYYLTDLVGIAKRQGERIAALILENPYEGLGVNTVEQAEVVERHW